MKSETSVPTPKADPWTELLDWIRAQVSEQTFNTWFLQTRYLDHDDRCLSLEGPNQFFVDWLTTHHLDLLQRAAAAVLGPGTQVEIRVSETPEVGRVGNTVHIPSAPMPSPESSHPSTRLLTPRDAGLNPRYVFENFVVGDNNRLSHAATQAVADQPGHVYNPLFLYGGVGLGKTHLMQAIGNRVLATHPRSIVHYVSAENFMNELIQAIRSGKTLEFKNKVRNVDVLLIDDIQFLSGKESTQSEFFHTFNALYNANKQIVVSSDRPPKEIPTIEERLRSRMEWGLITDVQAPNLETRIAILKRKVEKEEIHIPDEVLVFIAESVRSNIRELEGALIRLLAFAGLTKSTLTLESARQVLENFVQRDQPRRDLTMAEIIKSTSSYFQIGLDVLRSKVRTRQVAHARQVGMYLCRKHTGASFQQIGMKFGGRDHTTVVYAVDKVGKEVEKDPRVRQEVHELLQLLKD